MSSLSNWHSLTGCVSENAAGLGLHLGKIVLVSADLKAFPFNKLIDVHFLTLFDFLSRFLSPLITFATIAKCAVAKLGQHMGGRVQGSREQSLRQLASQGFWLLGKWTNNPFAYAKIGRIRTIGFHRKGDLFKRCTAFKTIP